MLDNMGNYLLLSAIIYVSTYASSVSNYKRKPFMRLATGFDWPLFKKLI